MDSLRPFKKKAVLKKQQMTLYYCLITVSAALCPWSLQNENLFGLRGREGHEINSCRLNLLFLQILSRLGHDGRRTIAIGYLSDSGDIKTGSTTTDLLKNMWTCTILITRCNTIWGLDCRGHFCTILILLRWRALYRVKSHI